MEVYKWALDEAQYYRKQSEGFLKGTFIDGEYRVTTQDKNDADESVRIADAYYKVAAKLEDTQEVNPVK